MRDCSVTLTGSPEQLVRVLRFWQTLLAEESATPAAVAIAASADRDAAAAELVRRLGGEPRWLALHIAEASQAGQGIPRSQLISDIAARLQISPAEAARQLNGWAGTLGRAWRKSYGAAPNPFSGQATARRGEWLYRLEPDLAALLLRAAEDKPL